MISEQSEGSCCWNEQASPSLPRDPAAQIPGARGPRAPFQHELACRAAEAAEAAGSLGGNDAYWAMHDWLMNNQDTFSDETLTQAARDMGLDPAALFTEMQSVPIAMEIAKESQLTQRMGLRSIPFIFVNNRVLHRFYNVNSN